MHIEVMNVVRPGVWCAGNVCPARHCRQLDPDVVWRVFPRQQMAFDFAKTCWQVVIIVESCVCLRAIRAPIITCYLPQSVAVFAFESEELGHQGQRKYLVTTYYHFSQKYL